MLPNLVSPRTFHTWLAQQLEDGLGASAIIELLQAEKSGVSLCRQMNVAHILNLPERRNSLLEACLSSDDPRVEAYAIGVDSYLQIAKYNSSDTAHNVVAFNLLPMLQSVLAELRASPYDAFTREVESILRVSLGVAYFFEKDLDKASAEASKAVYWAQHVGALFYVTRARSLLISVNAETGKISAAASLIEQEKENSNRPGHAQRFHERAYALMLYQLGQNEKSLRVLEDVLHLDADDWRPVASDLQRQRCKLGVGGMEGEVIRAFPDFAVEGWITNSMRCLVAAAALPRTNQNADKRQTLLEQAVDIWRDEPYAQQAWPSNFGRWVSGIAYLWQGKPSLAIGALYDVQVDDTQWFDLRLLSAGLELEVSLHLNHPELSPERPLKRLHSLFQEAKALPLASPNGLAERLLHWHPLAAAFAALVSNPVVELQTATRAIMRVGATSSVYDLTLPPAFAAEQVLRALDYDLRPRVKFSQAALGSDRLKKARLLTKYGEVNYWRPCLSAVSLIYGLVKLGQVENAQAIFHEYGVAPFSSAEYAMLPLLEHVRATTTKLLLGQVNPTDFSRLLLQYD